MAFARGGGDFNAGQRTFGMAARIVGPQDSRRTIPNVRWPALKSSTPPRRMP